MNNTTTYKRSMFGLTEINADTINANNLVLSGPLKVNTITSTAAGQSLSIDALGTGTLSLKSNGVTKMSASNTATDFYSNTTNIREGKSLNFYDASNTLKGVVTAVSFGQIYNTAGGVLAYFQVGGSNRLILGLGANQLLVPTTIATEAVGSNNTRLATTEFVTRATLGLTGITYSDVGSIDLTLITNNLQVGAGKILSIPNHSNVETELTYINDTLTGITYDVDSVATNFALSVIMNDILSIPSYANVKITLDNLSVAAQGVLGISYSDVGGIDMTTIANNLTISAGKILSIPNYSNVETTLTNINTKLTAISYDTSTGTNYTNVNSYLGIKAGNYLAFFDSTNTLKGYQQARSTGQLYGSNPNVPHLFEINGVSKFTISTTSIASTIYITAPTEVVGSNNTRLATTAFVTTATLGLTGITYSDVGSIDMTTITNNVTIGAGKTLSIPNYSNVETTLTTLTTNATGITYSAPYPLFIPQTTIAHDLYLATNKKLICDESWTKLYTTHDLTDSVGVGYFKGFMYNNGSIFTLSAVNPINVYDGTSSQINLKFSTREIEFGVDGMSLNWGSITLCSDIQLPTYTSLTGTLDSLTTKTTGMTYLSGVDRTTFDNNVKIEANKTLNIPSYENVETTLNQLSAYRDDFTDQLNNNNPIRWSSNSTLTYPDDEIGHRGIVRLPASDRYLYPVSSTNIFFWQDFKRIDFVFRITFSDTNMFYDIGLSDNNVGTNKSITWRYQNATSPNGWTPRVNGSLLTGWVSAATITTATTNWFYGSFTHYGSPTEKYIKFYIKNLTDFTEYSNTGAIETSIDATALYRPYFRATSTGGGTKYLDIDYVSIEYRNDRPNPQPQYV
jgi:hypothetical protein